jgi:sulfur carrier protein ThiS
MSEVLIMKLDLDPEVEVYMDSEGVSLDAALNQLELYPSEAVDVELEIVDRDDLEDYGTKGRDYIVVKKVAQFEKYDYELDDVLNELNIDIKKLRKLGVAVDEYEDDED